MTDKEKYRELCKTELAIPIFSRDWWLDAVCGKENWDVVVIEKGGKIVASWPYYVNKHYCFNMITMPKLTQTMGIWLCYPERQKYAKRLSFEKDAFKELIEKLPKVDWFNQSFHYSVTNWLPFYWKGYQQTTGYTYVIEDFANLEIVYDNFQSNIKTDIKKAKKVVSCYSDNNIENFYKINKLTFERQQLPMPYSLEFLKNLDKGCFEHNCRKIFYAVDEESRIHAAIYIVWDEQSAYYLLGGGHPELRHSGATSLLIWEAIQFAAGVTKKFDFEGSMVEPIERFFRGFGAVQKPYFIIKKSSKYYGICQSIKTLGKDLLGRA